MARRKMEGSEIVGSSVVDMVGGSVGRVGVGSQVVGLGLDGVAFLQFRFL
jgi:hypothetical protein